MVYGKSGFSKEVNMPVRRTTNKSPVDRSSLSKHDRVLLENPSEIDHRKKLAEMKKIELQNKTTEGTLRRDVDVKAKATAVFQTGRAAIEVIPTRLRSEFGKDFTHPMRQFLEKELISMMKAMAEAGK